MVTEQVKAPNDPSLITETHAVGRTDFFYKLSSDLHTHTQTHTVPHIYDNNIHKERVTERQRQIDDDDR